MCKLLEALEADIVWDDKTQTVTAVKEEKAEGTINSQILSGLVIE